MSDPDRKDRILLVDDEPDILRLMSLFLQHQGYDVVTAKNGLECLRKAREERPDLLILDVMMPDMNGFEVCAVLRDDEDGALLPIMMLSALSETPDKIKGLKAGADEYLTKPVDMNELAARVAMLLSRARRFQRAQPAQAPVTPARSARVIAFIGAQGGVGTTTVALNVATSLTQQQKAVIAVELRPYFGTFALQLKLSPGENLSHLLGIDVERIGDRAVGARLYKTATELRVLPGPQSVTQWGELEPAHVGAILREAAEMADYLVIDLPSVPSRGVQSALPLCDLLAVVVEPTTGGVQCACKLIDLLATWNQGGAQIGAVISNRSGGATALSLRQVQAEVNREIWGVVPQATEAFAVAMSHGLPLVAHRPESVPGMALTEMAGRLAAPNVIGIRP